jgi:hypothetical protein
MSQQSPIAFVPSGLDAGDQLAQLRHVLGLVEEVAGRIPWPAGADAALDEAACLSSAYADAMPIVQKRFDALARETAGWAAAGVEALLAGGGAPPQAAAAALADRLSGALAGLAGMLRD